MELEIIKFQNTKESHSILFVFAIGGSNHYVTREMFNQIKTLFKLVEIWIHLDSLNVCCEINSNHSRSIFQHSFSCFSSVDRCSCYGRLLDYVSFSMLCLFSTFYLYNNSAKISMYSNSTYMVMNIILIIFVIIFSSCIIFILCFGFGFIK